MIFPKSKQEITEAVLKILPRGKDHSIPIGDVVYRWWLTGRGGKGLRLNDAGVKSFDLAHLEFYEFPINPREPLVIDMTRYGYSASSVRLIQELGKKITSPYYLGVHPGTPVSDRYAIIRGSAKGYNKSNGIVSGTPYIRIYDHKTAMMITLHGTLQAYLEHTNI